MPTQHPNDPAQFLTSLFQSSQDMMKPFTDMAGVAQPHGSLVDPFGVFNTATQMWTGLQQEYIRHMTDMWLSMTGMGGGAGDDKRFAGEAWRKDPRFDALTNGYLAYSRFLQGSVENAPVDDKMKDQLRFAVKQYVDAMSPANFLASNPEAIQLALETGGQSLVEGMNLFAQDMARGRVSMTDETAFEVGKNVGVTPGTVVYRNELIELIQYTPQTKQVRALPLVIIPPCINKYYILDLTPENSFVRYALEQGHTVFLVSWRNVTIEQGRLTWDDYLKSGVMQAIDVAREITSSDKVNTLGFCIGGTLLSSALAVMRQNGEDKVASLTLLTTMLDFAMPGEIGALLTADSVEKREASIGEEGVLEGKDLALAFSALRANDLIWPYVVNSYLKGKAPPAFDLLYWNGDSADMSGPMYSWYLRNMYLENNLRVPGGTTQCGVPVDLSKIRQPAYVLATREDHIVPWVSAHATTRLLPNATFVLGASGHIAGIVNPPAANKYCYWTNAERPENPEDWLQHATRHEGSWWADWQGWMAENNGEAKVAARVPGDGKLRIVEDAPGAYVSLRLGAEKSEFQ